MVQRKKASNVPPSEFRNDLYSTRLIATVLRATRGELLRDGTEHVQAFVSVTVPSLDRSEAETKTLGFR